MQDGGASPSVTGCAGSAGQLRRIGPAMRVFLAALALRLVLAPFFDFCFDDAYITFRVAGNLARGEGMVFNAGERVLVTSTPLYTLLMTPGELLGTGSPLWSRLMNSAASAAACLLVYLLLRGRARRGLLVFAVAALALSPLSVFMTLTGMESPVVSMLLLLATLLYRDGHGLRLGLVLGACFLVRPEGAFAAALFALAVLLFRRDIAWRVLAPLAAVAGGWLAFSFAVFGSPLPHSVVAKEAYFAMHGCPPLLNARVVSKLLWATIPLFPAMVLCLPCGLRSAIRRRREFLPMAAWTCLVLAAQVFSGFNLPWWYVDQITPPLLALLVLGAEDLLQSRAGLRLGTVLRRRGAVAAVTILSVLGSLFVAGRMRLDYSDTRTMDHIMRDVAGWFVEEGIPAHRTVAVEAIGRIGYETRLRILDTFGLASPEMVPLIRAETMSDEHVMHLLHPDYLISGAVHSPEAVGGYEVVGSVLCPPLARPVSRGEWADRPDYCYIYAAPPAGTPPVGTGAPPHRDGQR